MDRNLTSCKQYASAREGRENTEPRQARLSRALDVTRTDFRDRLCKSRGA
jgi:hypothetical protein